MEASEALSFTFGRQSLGLALAPALSFCLAAFTLAVGRWPMERLQADLRAYYERQAAKLLDLARECSDAKTAQKLVAMAHEYIEKRSICLTG